MRIHFMRHIRISVGILAVPEGFLQETQELFSFKTLCRLASYKKLSKNVIFFVVYVKKSSTFAPALKETLKNVEKES